MNIDIISSEEITGLYESELKQLVRFVLEHSYKPQQYDEFLEYIHEEFIELFGTTLRDDYGYVLGSEYRFDVRDMNEVWVSFN